MKEELLSIFLITILIIGCDSNKKENVRIELGYMVAPNGHTYKASKGLIINEGLTLKALEYHNADSIKIVQDSAFILSHDLFCKKCKNLDVETRAEYIVNDVNAILLDSLTRNYIDTISFFEEGEF